MSSENQGPKHIHAQELTRILVTIIITLEGTEKVKTSGNDKTV